MSIVNPYKDVAHKVFKRTFLQGIEITLDFEPRISAEEFSSHIVPFINKAFNQNLTSYTGKAVEQAELTSDDNQVRFLFAVNSAKVIISPIVYKSFSVSAIPYIEKLVHFLKEVAHAELILRVSINKTNIWPIQTDNITQSLRNASFFVFKKEHIEDIANFKFDASVFPISASKEAVVKCGDSASLNCLIRVELKDSHNISFMLRLTAQALNIKVENLMFDLPILNDIIFGAFTDIVSNNVFDIMDKPSL